MTEEDLAIGKKVYSDEKKKEKELLMGNRAVVQGLLEANVGFTTAYPGTPSTEIQMQLFRLRKEGRIYFEFSVNEKVALEMAGAAALSGVRSAVIMKHVGLNVASDPMMALAYFGVKGGMVVFVVDDPGCLSSQNEQDSRYWGRFAHLPVLEPSTSQEIKETIVQAYELSEKYNMIFIIRLTNFTALNTSEVEKNEVKEPLTFDGEFEEDVRYAIPARYIYHKELHQKLKTISNDSAFQSLNSLMFGDTDSEKLIITQGSIYPMVEYMRNYFKLDIPIFKINTIHPLPEKVVLELLEKYKYVYFVEELESYLEKEIAALVGYHNLNVKIIGKEKLAIPVENRIIPDVLFEAFKRISADPTDDTIFSAKLPELSRFEKIIGREDLLIPRTLPRLCDGCPHRGAFYSIKQAVGRKALIPSDIGCYALGQVPPVEVGNYWLCMGASIGTALGLSLTNKKPVIAIIGDGTFFHAGIPPLLDAVMYNHNITVAILNNYLTAMTGGQPTPSSHEKIAYQQKQIDIEKLVRGLGVEWVRSVDVRDVRENTKLVKEAINYDGPSVIIFNGDCIVELYRHNLDLGEPPYVDQEICNQCGICFIEFSCPSIIKVDGKIKIREDTCSACNICVNVCPRNAIIPRKK
ncbi:MAG: thiamine pyrophosphate-dependent enzyme [Candidatus Heimdallarchaeaceae archaeon]